MHAASSAVLTLVLILVAGCATSHDPESATATPAPTAPVLGVIDFPTSGDPVAQSEFELGVLALHSFWYAEARDRFRRALELDPDFAMAYWGETMSWDPAAMGQPEPDSARAALARLADRESIGSVEWTPREQEWMGALRVLWDEDGDMADRRVAHAEAMARLAERYPDDDEALAFASIAHARAHDYAWDDPEAFEAYIGPLEDLFRRNPRHPGAAHYLIHAYDRPGGPNATELARRGLPAARAYAEIAPNSSHALHMPSHIFRELGMWAEMAASNERSYEVSTEWQERTGRPLAARDWHAMDWLHLAYIKLGRFRDAQRLIVGLDSLVQVAASRDEPAMPMVGILGMLQARHGDAARMVGLPSTFPVAEIPDVTDLPPVHRMQVLMATGRRAALAGQPEIVDPVVRALVAMGDESGTPPAVFFRAISDMIGAELLLAMGDTTAALTAIREMLDRPDAPPFMGGAGLSSPRATIAEIQLTRGVAENDPARIREAAAIYDMLLETEPRDGALLLGRLRAARALGDDEAGDGYEARLRELWSTADPALVGLIPSPPSTLHAPSATPTARPSR